MAASTGVSSTLPTNTISAATPTPETNQSSGLSSSAGAGIGVGATISLFALVGSGLFYFFRLRRSTLVMYEAASVRPITPTPPSESHDRSKLVGSQLYTEQELNFIPR